MTSRGTRDMASLPHKVAAPVLCGNNRPQAVCTRTDLRNRRIVAAQTVILRALSIIDGMVFEEQALHTCVHDQPPFSLLLLATSSDKVLHIEGT